MQISKTLRLAGLMASYFSAGFKINLTTPAGERLKKHSMNASRHARLALKTLNLDLEVTGYNIKDMKQRNFLIVSNHMSYLDAVIMNAIQPSLFVTSVDMGEKFFLGTFAEMGGSIFVERRNRDRVDSDRSSITKALKEGYNVVIYPEGTSTNGSSVLPFKKSLLTAAAEAGVDILPAVLKYKEINGQPFQPSNCDKVCWYGKMDFVSHISGVLGLKSWKAQVSFLKPIAVSAQSTRDELASSAFSAISNCYMNTEPVSQAAEIS